MLSPGETMLVMHSCVDCGVHKNPGAFHNLLACNSPLRSVQASVYAVAMETGFRPIYPFIEISARTPTDIQGYVMYAFKSS